MSAIRTAIDRNKLQLYSLATPNGMKINIMLEELKLAVPDFDYDAHRIDLSKNEQFSPQFLEISPNNKIPAMVDPSGPNGQPLSLFESGAILVYLAEKYHMFMPVDLAKRAQTFEWLFWQVGGVGPMFGQFGHFYKSAQVKLPYAIERYANETKRLLRVLDHQLDGYQFIVGNEYTIADMAIWPWFDGLSRFYTNSEDEWFNNFTDYPNVLAWSERCSSRPAYQSARNVTPIHK